MNDIEKSKIPILGRLKAACHSAYAIWVVSIIAVCEAIWFPIPVDIFMLTAIFFDTSRWAKWAIWVTFSSVLGGILGYFIGYYAFDMLALPLIELLSITDSIEIIKEAYQEYGGSLIFLAAFTPLPYKAIALTSGWLEVSFWLFISLSLVGRGLRFGLVAYLAHRFGPDAERLILKHVNWLGWGVVVVCVLFLVVTWN